MQSIWNRTAESKPHAALRGDLTIDAAVIGGGKMCIRDSIGRADYSTKGGFRRRFWKRMEFS